MNMEPKARGVQFLGAINIDPVSEVYRQASEVLGSRLERISDGEPGARRLWISYQYPLFRAKTFLEDGNPEDLDRKALFTPLALKKGAEEDIEFGQLGYAREAIVSYLEFAEAKRNGIVPEHCRFQVSIPTPCAVVYSWIVPNDRAKIEPFYEQAILREIDTICAAIPADQLAIQFDVCHEMVWWDGRGFPAPFDNVEEEVISRLARLAAQVPDKVQLGFHLCYGDLDHKHFVEPIDGAKMTGLANAISGAISRDISWIHVPVPISRNDAAFFAPMADLDLHPETRLFLGLVHHTDGVEGTMERIAAAKAFVDDFGAATECGMGRRPAKTIPRLLEIHAAVTDPIV